MKTAYTVSPLQMSLLLETARHRFLRGSYAHYYVTQWVNMVTKGEQPPVAVDEWLNMTKETK